MADRFDTDLIDTDLIDTDLIDTETLLADALHAQVQSVLASATSTERDDCAGGLHGNDQPTDDRCADAETDGGRRRHLQPEAGPVPARAHRPGRRAQGQPLGGHVDSGRSNSTVVGALGV